MKQIKEIYMYILGAIVVLGVLSLIVMLVVYRPEMTDVINIAVGSLLAAFGSVVGYFYGSSKGSADKNEILKNSGGDVWGCTDKQAQNYNRFATIDDGSCIYTANPEK